MGALGWIVEIEDKENQPIPKIGDLTTYLNETQNKWIKTVYVETTPGFKGKVGKMKRTQPIPNTTSFESTVTTTSRSPSRKITPKMARTSKMSNTSSASIKGPQRRTVNHVVG